MCINQKSILPLRPQCLKNEVELFHLSKLIVYRKGDLVKHPMKSRDAPKIVLGVGWGGVMKSTWWGGVGLGGVGHEIHIHGWVGDSGVSGWDNKCYSYLSLMQNDANFCDRVFLKYSLGWDG